MKKIPVRTVGTDRRLLDLLELAPVGGVPDSNSIKLDGAYPWRDMLGEVVIRTAPGPGTPTLAAFRGGAVREYFFAAGDTADSRFHVPHDHVPGSDLFIHTHWSHNGTAIADSLVVTLGITYSKGHSQGVFQAEIAPVITIAGLSIANTPQYAHRIDEIQLSAKEPTATQLDTDLIEPDGIILINLVATTIPTISGGTQTKPTILYLDLHYQSTNLGTKNKINNFYT